MRNVLLYFPHGGTIRTEFAISAFTASTAAGSPIAELRELHAGPLMGMARNAITADFLASPHEWLLMADSDIQFTPGTVRAMVDAADPAERPVIGALCWTLIPDGKIATMYKADLTDDQRFGFTSYGKDEIPDSEVVRVDATGAAFLLLHRSVFKRLTDHDPEFEGLWFAELAADGRLFGEDFSFCIRCRDAGIPVHVHTGARTGHVKAVIIGEPGP